MKLAALVLGLAGLSAAQLTQNPDSPSSNVICTVVKTLNNHRDPPQSPCLVAAYLLSACDLSHAVHVDALLADQVGYPIPGTVILGNGTLPVNKCTCASITYMALAGCVACQKQHPAYPPYASKPPSQSTWTAKCGTDDMLIGREFTQDLIPQGVAIPAWAYSNLTQSPDSNHPGTIDLGFSLPAVSQFVTDSNLPDVTPDPVPPSTTPPAAGQTDTPPPAPSPASKSHTPVGAIVGGVIGGVAALALGGLAIWWFMRRTSGSRTKGTLTPATDSSWVAGHAAAPSYESGSWTASPSPPLRGVASPLPSSGLMSPANPPITKLYDPDDPTTFPPRM